MKKYLLYLTVALAACQGDEDKADAYGNFEANETVISSQASGELLKFSVEQGDKLAQGAIIGLIDSSTLHNQKVEILANIAAVESQKTSIRAEQNVLVQEENNLEREITRVKKLIESDAATTKQLDDLQGALQVLQSRKAALASSYTQINAQVESIRARLLQVNDMLDKCVVTNPISGVVLTKLSQERELVGVGKPLYKLADMSVMDLRAYISETQLADVQLGQQVTVNIDRGEGQQSVTGTVRWIASEAEFTPKIIQTKEERVNLVYAIKVQVPNNQGLLKIGMPGEVYFND